MEPVTIVFLLLAMWPLVAPDKPANCYVNEQVVVEDTNGNPKNAELITPVVCTNLKVLEYKE